MKEEKKRTGELKIYEDNCMSLSCRGSIVLTDNIITDISFKGYPRPGKDTWAGYFEHLKIGGVVGEKTILNLLSYNRHDNLVSFFIPTKKMIVCPECGGEGVIRNPNPGISDFPPIVDCDHCHGTGKIEETDNGKE